MPLHIDGEGSHRIVIRDGGRDAVRCDRCPVLRKDVAAIDLAYTVACIYRIGSSIGNRRCEVLDRLIVINGRGRTVFTAMVSAKCNVAEAARHLRTRCSQAFEHLDRAAEVAAVGAVHVVELLCERLEDIREIGRGDTRMLGDHRRVAVCLRLLDLHIAALERVWRAGVMLEEEVRMPRIVCDGEILRLLHVDIAGVRRVTAAREFRESACDETRPRAVVLVVPRAAVLQIEICLALCAGDDRAREPRVRGCEGKTCQRVFSIFGIFAVCQDIALNLDLAHAENARLVHIDKDTRTLAHVADGAMLGVAAFFLLERQSVELSYT